MTPAPRAAAGGGPRRGAADAPGGPAGAPGRALRRLLLVLPLVAPVHGCADTVSPVLGGLRLGTGGRAFHTPVMENERPPFRYPDRAWRDRVGGETRLRIHINREGVVDSAYVLESSGHAALDSAALAGARQLRYRPARQGGRAIGVWAVLPVRYPMPREVDGRDEP